MMKRSNAVADYRARAKGKSSRPPMTKSSLGKGPAAFGKVAAMFGKAPSMFGAFPPMFGKAPFVFGKSAGKAQGAKGQWFLMPGPMVKGKFGGKGSGKVSENKTLDRLGKIDSSLKVWVGGLSEKTDWKKLEAHFVSVARPVGTAIMPKGTACVAFKTTDDVDSAISTLNGSDLDGKAIEVDVWAKKEKKEGEDKPKRKMRSVITAAFTKQRLGAPPNVDPKIKAGLKAIEPSMKVWIGGLDKKVTWKKIKEHFTENGCEPKMTSLLKVPGTACCGFESEADALSAIATVNGTTLEGKVIEVDSWTKPEREEE